MNICLLSLEWPPYGGGIGTYMYNLAQGLSELKHNVTVITHDKKPEKINGVKIAQVQLPSERGKFQRKLFRWIWEPHHTWSKRAWQYFKSIEKTNSFDIIETAEYGAWARHFIGNLNIPIVVRCHTPASGVKEIPSNGTPWKMPLWLSLEERRERIQTRRADAIGSPSYVLSNHISLIWSIPTGRIKVLPNPVNTQYFRPLENENRKKELLYTGRLQYNKGVFDLIEAVIPLLKEHPDLIVRLIGKDIKNSKCVGGRHKMTSEEILSRIPAENKRQVIIAGWMPNDELLSCQQNAMCAVVPSRGFESFSYTLTQHMACGTAVVASHCGGPTEIVNDGIDGMLVPVGDKKALTTTIKKLIENPNLCRQLGLQARRKVEEQFSIPVVIPRIINWYEQIIENHKKGDLV
ncbi:MAG: hypothetical protein A2Y10_03205 [Planctomycetes bacterium GWF2_41_51]|nr:MAG: hypothetical protein A2Y10_03205 [Planctomycetes bacterium GWF2_41_51]